MDEEINSVEAVLEEDVNVDTEPLHVEDLQTVLEPFMVFGIYGTLHEQSDGRCIVDFNSVNSDDIPFHISVRPSEKQIGEWPLSSRPQQCTYRTSSQNLVFPGTGHQLPTPVSVMNTQTDNVWNYREERIHLPFKPGMDFTLHIMALRDCFQVFVNGSKAHKYVYRQPLDAIHDIKIYGQVDIRHTSLGGKELPVPYEASIFSLKRADIQGVVAKHATRIEISLYSSTGDIVFYVNPRVYEKEVIRNTRINGEWKEEERESLLNGDFPFRKNAIFDLSLINEPETFTLFMNGLKHSEYKHRISPALINRIEIKGHLTLLRCDIG